MIVSFFHFLFLSSILLVIPSRQCRRVFKHRRRVIIETVVSPRDSIIKKRVFIGYELSMAVSFFFATIDSEENGFCLVVFFLPLLGGHFFLKFQYFGVFFRPMNIFIRDAIKGLIV